MIQRVLGDSAAEKAGIQTGDIVVAINGINVGSAVDVKNMVGNLRVGEKVQITVIRAGKVRNITMIVDNSSTSGNGTKPAISTASSSGKPFWEKGLQ